MTTPAHSILESTLQAIETLAESAAMPALSKDTRISVYRTCKLLGVALDNLPAPRQVPTLPSIGRRSMTTATGRPPAAFSVYPPVDLLGTREVTTVVYGRPDLRKWGNRRAKNRALDELSIGAGKHRYWPRAALSQWLARQPAWVLLRTQRARLQAVPERAP